MNTSALVQLAAETSEAAHAAEEATSGLSEFGLNPVTIALQAGVFILLYILLKKFALKNIVKTLEDRREKISEGLSNAEKIQRQLEESEQKHQEMLKEARAAADTIIAQAQQESGVLVKEAEDKAAVKAEKIVSDAKNQIDSEIVKARQELKKETLSLVAQATGIILQEKVDAKADEKLIKKALETAQ